MNIKKIIVGLSAIALVFGIFVMPISASADTTSDVDLSTLAFLNADRAFSGYAYGPYRPPIVTGSTFNPYFPAYVAPLGGFGGLWAPGIRGGALGDALMLQGLMDKNANTQN